MRAGVDGLLPSFWTSDNGIVSQGHQFELWYVICDIKADGEAGVAVDTERQSPVVTSGDEASGRDPQASSLLAMLIAGLVLVTVGAVFVMVFV
ncbi:MAG: hypothetical protein KDK08_06380 [Rhizobiaceae bacterium]|nr:hypothetical protein [Rhizobiaceae bacterium]